MVNQQVLKHHWEEVCDQLQEKWQQLKASDLPSFPGNIDQLIGRIQQKTGESREAIEAYLSDLTQEGSEAAHAMRQRVEAGAARVAESAKQGAQAIRDGYAEAGEMIRERPGQSFALAFGLGLVAGVGVALLLRSSSRQSQPSLLERGRACTSGFGKQVRDSLAEMASMR